MNERIAFQSAGAKRKPRTYLDIAADYAPYHTMPEFNEGTTDYLEGYTDPRDGVKSQAWARGQEAASRYTRQFR